MEDVPHDCLVRNFGVVAVCVIDRIVSSLRYVGCERVTIVIVVGRMIGLPAELD